MARKSATKPDVARERRVLNLVPSRDTARDWTMTAAVQSGALRAARLPDSADLRQSWWKVGDQGQTGSCVGWAAADGVMRYLLVSTKRLDKSEQISVRFVWMASKETDEFTVRPETFIEESGTSLKNAADICRKYGVPLASDLPFSISTTMYAGSGDELYARASQRRAASYFNIGKDTAAWKRALADGRPILAGLDVDDAWMDVPASGVLGVYKPATRSGGHAVTIVGYDKSHFIIRNSWGKSWGDEGFAYASPDYIKKAFFDEGYMLTA